MPIPLSRFSWIVADSTLSIKIDSVISSSRYSGKMPVSSIILTIIERFKELGMLKAMGTTPKEIILLIFFESFFVCFIVTIAGLIVGYILSVSISYYGIDFSALTSHNRYFVVSGIVRPRVTLSGLYWPGLLSITVSIISSYIPARIAARKITAETLRFAWGGL